MNQGEIFKKEVKKLKITQEDAAIKLGISLSTIIRMFKEKTLELHEIEVIHEKLGIVIPSLPKTEKPAESGFDFEKAYYKLQEKYIAVLEELRNKSSDK